MFIPERFKTSVLYLMCALGGAVAMLFVYVITNGIVPPGPPAAAQASPVPTSNTVIVSTQPLSEPGVSRAEFDGLKRKVGEAFVDVARTTRGLAASVQTLSEEIGQVRTDVALIRADQAILKAEQDKTVAAMAALSAPPKAKHRRTPKPAVATKLAPQATPQPETSSAWSFVTNIFKSE